MADVVQETTQNSGGADNAPTGGNDVAAKLADMESKFAAVLKERDTLAERAKLADTLQTKHDKLAADLAALQAERDKLTGEVTTLSNEKRETAILDKLVTSLPHASRNDIRRAFLGMAADGKIERYGQDADKVASTVIEALKTENSALLRPPVGASGGTNPAPVQSAQKDPLRVLFGARR